MPWSPTSVSGLQCWFKADAGAYKDLGSTLCSNGDSVEQWNDQSGNGNNGTQTTSSKRPLYATNSINGLPTVGSSTGNGSVLTLGSSVALTGAFTLFVVGSRASLDPWCPYGNSGGAAAFRHVNDGKFYVLNDAVSFIGTTSNPTGAFAIRFKRDGSNAITYLLSGGSEVAVGTLSGTITLNGMLASVGAGVYGTSTCLFGELVLYNVATGSTDDQNASDYFNSRWALPLGPGAPSGNRRRRAIICSGGE